MMSYHWSDLQAGYVFGLVVVYGGPQAQNHAAVVGDRRAGIAASWTTVSGQGLEERVGGGDDEVEGRAVGLLIFYRLQ